MKLRPYQDRSVQSLREGFGNGHTRQVLCASTGAGKSIIMLAMIKLAMEKDSRVLFICERRVLVEQFSAHLAHAGIDHGVIMARHWRWRPDRRIQVASAQTLERMEGFPKFDICFIDEVHASMRKSVVEMIKLFPNMKIVGATATPFNPKLAEHFSSVTNVITMRELVDDGHLVPFRVFAASEIDVDGLKIDSMGEFEKKGMEDRARRITGDVVADYIRLTNQIYGEQRKGIVFSSGIAHGQDLMQKFNESGVMAVQISSNDTDEFKAEVLADFKKPDTHIKLVISSEILERGFDQSDIDFVILAKAVKKSFSKFVQMIGRGARLHPSKEFAIVQDHGNNWIRFAEQWDELYGSGVTELTSAPDKSLKKEPSKKQKEDAKCPKCGRINGGNPCAQCGHVRPLRNEVVAVAGKMEELNGTSTKKAVGVHTSEYKKAFYEGLVFYARSKGMKDGWAFFKYQERFNIKPAWEKIAAPPSSDVLSFIFSQNIRHGKSKIK